MGVKNTMLDLNNILFEQLERLNDKDITGEEFEEEKERAKSMAQVAQTIINNNDLALRTMKTANEYGISVPDVLQIGSGNAK